MAKTNWREEYKKMEAACMAIADQYADLARARECARARKDLGAA